MSRAEVAAILRQTGLPVLHRWWPDGSERRYPALSYVREGTDSFYADGSVYWKTDRWSVVLYEQDKDDEVEEAVEAALDQAGVAYTREDDGWVEDERLHTAEWTFALPR